MFDRILIPLDGSAFSESCLPFAEAIPCRRVLLLYVEPPESRERGELGLSPHGALTYLERHAQRFRARGLEVERVVDYGDPAERIVDMASEAQLIVLARHAGAAGSHPFYGDYADRVARHAPAPALLVRGDDHAMPPAGFARVVVPLDGSPAAEEALPFARRMANSLSLPIHLVRVEPPKLADQGSVNTSAEIERYFRLLLLRLDTGMPVRWEARQGDAALELLAHIAPTDLVAMTIQGEGGSHRWRLGTVAARIVRQAPAPVLLVRDSLQSRSSLAFTESTGETGTGLSEWWQPEGFDASHYGEPLPIG